MTALGAHVARHRRQPLRRRLLVRAHRLIVPNWLLNWAWNRQATPYVPHVPDLEDARHDAFMVRVEPHVPPPPAVIQARLTALLGVLHHDRTGSGQPPAAVQPDVDVPGLEHLTAGQYSDDTLAFRRFVDGGQE